jgi:hypothetical protein
MYRLFFNIASKRKGSEEFTRHIRDAADDIVQLLVEGTVLGLSRL